MRRVGLGKWERRGEEKRCREEIAFAHHREGNGISEPDNGLAVTVVRMAVSSSLLEQLSRGGGAAWQ